MGILGRWMALAVVFLHCSAGIAIELQDNDIGIVASRLIAHQHRLYGTVDPSNLMDTMLDDGSWENIDYSDRHSVDMDGWQPHIHFSNVAQMAVAYSMPRNPCYKNPSLLDKIQKSLEFIHVWIGDPLVYSDKKHPNRRDLDNWWWTQVGDAQKMMVALLLVKDDLPPSDIKRYSTFLIDRTSDPSYLGMNLASAAEITLYKGCIEDDAQLVYKGFSAYASILELVDTKFPIKAEERTGEGFQYDYSFHQHRRQLQSGSYGFDLIPALTNSMLFAQGTSFETAFTQENRFIYSKGILEGHLLLSYRGTMDFGCKGRSMVKKGFDETLIGKMKRVDSRHADIYEKWEKHVAHGSDFPMTGNKYFWDSNIMTHHGKRYYMSAKIQSVRNVGTESINQENQKGRNLPKGATNILVTGDEYDGIYPVWDWTRIPGTTAIMDASGAYLPDGYLYALNEFGGGVTDGVSGVIAYVDSKDEAKYNDHLTAKKAYFFMDDFMLCLGTAIKDDSSFPVATSVNQCLQNGFVYYGDERGENVLDVSTTTDDVHWVHHGEVGYLFPSSSEITIQGKKQTGSWKSINGTQSGELVGRDVFSLWINHGMNPDNACYQYAVLPNKTREETAALAKDFPFSVVRNDSIAQIVYSKSLKQFGVVCYEACGIDLPGGLEVEVDRPVVLLFKMLNDRCDFVVADPLYDDDGEDAVLNISVSEKRQGGEVKEIAKLQVDLPQGQYLGSSVAVDCATGVVAR